MSCRVVAIEERSGATGEATFMMCGDVNSTEMPEPYTAAEAEASLITGEHLRMRAIGEPPLMRDLAPGRPVIWEVGVRADAPDPGATWASAAAVSSLRSRAPSWSRCAPALSRGPGAAAPSEPRSCSAPRAWTGSRTPHRRAT